MSNTNVVSVDDVLAHLGIDYQDDAVITNINRAINTADAYLKGSIGVDYPTDDPRAKELALLLVADFYDNRELTTTVSASTRKLVESMSLQLRLELRRGSHA